MSIDAGRFSVPPSARCWTEPQSVIVHPLLFQRADSGPIFARISVVAATNCGRRLSSLINDNCKILKALSSCQSASSDLRYGRWRLQ